MALTETSIKHIRPGGEAHTTAADKNLESNPTEGETAEQRAERHEQKADDENRRQDAQGAASVNIPLQADRAQTG